MFNFLDIFKNWFNIDGTPMMNDSFDANGNAYGEIEPYSHIWENGSTDFNNGGSGSDF